MSETPHKLSNTEKIALALLGDVDKPYYEALGRFMDKFAQVEGLLHLCLCIELKLELRTANCVLSGVRASEAIASIKRLAEQRGVCVPTDVAEAFEHIGTLNTARNDIVHYGSEGAGNWERAVSTALRAHTDYKIKRWTVTADTLTEMYLDAEKAIAILLKRQMPELQLNQQNDAALGRAWQYKYPSAPTQTGNEGGQRGQKPGRVHKARPLAWQTLPPAARRPWP